MPWYSGAPLYGEAGVTVCALASWLTSISKWLAPQGVAGSQGMKRHGTWGKGTELDLVPRDPVGLSPRLRRHKSCEWHPISSSLNFDMSIHGVCTRWCVYVGVCVSPGILEVMDDGRAAVKPPFASQSAMQRQVTHGTPLQPCYTTHQPTA